MRSEKRRDDNQPPSLFDNLDLFAAKPEKDDGTSAEAAPAGEAASGDAALPALPPAGLTGTGPMQALFDFNFRQYSAYVICSRAIPALEDGLKPVQRRIMHSLWEKDDGRYTKVANIVGHAMQYHPHGDASIGDALCVLANKLWGKGLGEIDKDDFKGFIGDEIRLTPVTCADDQDVEKTIKFYMGSNTPERKDYIMDSLVCDSSEF